RKRIRPAMRAAAPHTGGERRAPVAAHMAGGVRHAGASRPHRALTSEPPAALHDGKYLNRREQFRRPSPLAFGVGAGSFVVGGGNELRVLLRAPLEGQKIIIATSAAWEAPAQRRACLIDAAAALFRVKEAAHAAEDMVLLAAHRILCTPPLHRELRL